MTSPDIITGTRILAGHWKALAGNFFVRKTKRR